MLRFKYYHFKFSSLSEILFALNKLTRCFKSTLTGFFSFLESTFIEIVNPGKSNIIVQVFYRHPSMDLTDFTDLNYLNKLLEKISKKQKSLFLLGDFNFNLLNYKEDDQTKEFLNFLASNSFMPLILQTIRITSHSNILIDNIF